MFDNRITIQVLVHAPKQKTWDYYTMPGHITQWNFADPSWHCPRAENNMIVGGKYLARMEAKDGSFGFDFEAFYTAIVDHGFSYSFGDRTAAVDFVEDGEYTKVTVSFDPENENPIELQRNGWQAILNNFKNYTETH
jgi:uncharacterized protein YndB with AHSA1/START domain